MKILVVPLLTTLEETKRNALNVEEQIVKINPRVSIANIASWSVFSPTGREAKTVTEMLAGGYHALSNAEVFRAFDVYIGVLPREDFEVIDLIIFQNEKAKDIFYERYEKGYLPKAVQEIVSEDGEVGGEVYRRTVIRNFGA